MTGEGSEEAEHASPPVDSGKHQDRKIVSLASAHGAPTFASYAAAVLEGRKKLQRFLPGDFFADPAFDMLLDLLVATERGEVRPVKCCALASRVPHSTALRYLDLMEKAGLVSRKTDDVDARRSLVELTPSAWKGMCGWLAEISSIPLRRE